MNKTVQYLFDPLCGWCYGATPAISGLLDLSGVSLELLPTGLFSGAGARPMDDAFAAYAWANDQRIEHMTGQRFTEQYRHGVLRDRAQRFDSGPATTALTAVWLSDPTRQLDALKALQHARYVYGADMTSPATLAGLLEALDLKAAAARAAQPDAELVAVNRARMHRAQALMREFGARGVPTLIAGSGSKRWLLDLTDSYSIPHALARQLETA